jgi:phage-related protein
MVKPTSKMKKVMDEYGLSLENTDGTMKPLRTVMDELRTKMGRLDKSTQSAAAATLFGKESLAGMLAVVNASPEDYEKLTGAINNSDGAAKAMADTMNDNLQGQMTLMGSALEGLGLQIYEKMEGPLKEAAKTAIESISRISKSLTDGELSGSVDKLAEGFGNLITKIAEGVETWLPRIITAFTWVMDNSNEIATGIIAIGTALLVFKVANIVMALVEAFKLAKAAQEGLTVATWLYEAAMAAVGGPVILIIAVIAALVAGVIYLWNTNEGFRTFWIGVWQAISDFFVGIWTAIIAFFTETIPTVFNNFIAIVSALPGKIAAFFTNIYNNFITWGAGVIAWVAATIPKIINSVIEFFNQLPGRIGFALGYALGTIIKWGIAAFNYLVTNVPKWIRAVVTFFSQLPGKIWTWLASAIVKIATWGSQMYSKMTSAVSKAISAVITFFAQLPGKVWTWLLNTIAKVAQFGSNLSSKTKQAGADMVSSMVSSVASLPGKMMSVGANIVKGVWNGIKGLGGWLKSKVSNFFGGIVDGAKSALGIKSPSRIFRDQVGAMMAKGVAVGFDDESSSVEDKMKKNLSNLTAKMSATVDYETASTTAKVVAKHDYASATGQSSINESDNKSINPTIIANLIVDGKEFTQTVVAPNQKVLNDFYKGR